MRIVFEQVLKMSLAGSWVILLVLIARLVLRKAPKRFSYALWALVLLRLLCPVSLESPVSMMPAREESSYGSGVLEEDISLSQTALAAYHAVGDAANGGLGSIPIHTENSESSVRSAMHREVWTLVLRALWLPGLMVLLIANVISMLRLRRRLIGAARLRENIWIADHINTAFVLGVLRPRIYLPSSLSPNEQDYILLHEQTHIRRLDPLWKLLGFAALCVHWFNPLVWIAFRCAERDMELSCDESVLARMGAEIKCDYAASLLRLASGERHFASPLAFGEGGTKQRIQNVLHYRKPAFWVIAVCVIAVTGLAVGLLTDPVRRSPIAASPSELAGMSYRVEEVYYANPLSSFYMAPENAPQYRFGNALYEMDEASERSDDRFVYCGDWVRSELSQEDYNALFFAYDAFEQPQELWQNNASMWQCAGQDSFYLLFLQKDGSIYLGRGEGNAKRSAEETGPVIWWIFKLAEDGPVPLSSADLIGDYEVAEILYADGIYSFSYTLDTAPFFRITDDNAVWEMHPNTILSETRLKGGHLEKTELTAENFDELFYWYSLPHLESPAELREHCLQAWVADAIDGECRYWLLTQEDGSLYLASGYQEMKDMSARIRWLFRLERCPTNTKSKENEVSSSLIEAIGESEEYNAYYTELLSCKLTGYAEQTVEAFNASIASTPKRLDDLLEYYAYVSAALPKDDPEYDFLTITLHTSLTELYNEALNDECVFHFYLLVAGDPVEPLNSEEALLLANDPQYEFMFTATVWVDYASDDPALTIGERDEVMRGLQNGLQEYVNSLPRTALTDTSVRDLLNRRAQEIAQSYPQTANMNVRVSFSDIYYSALDDDGLIISNEN